MPSKGPAKSKASFIITAFGAAGEEIIEETLPFVSDGVDPAASRTAVHVGSASAKGGSLTAQRTGHREPGGAALDLDSTDRAAGFQPCQGGVERAEGDAREQPKVIAQSLAQLISVKGLFFQ
ncbi:MAG: hypothetical protein M0008_04105 [Actinomycetota bacterium]|nr:hypothetical protein [Actinomycetota bacterium]